MIILIQVKNYAPKLNSDSGLKKMIMTLTELGIKRNCPKLTKGIYEKKKKSITNIVLSKILSTFRLASGHR